MSKEGAIMCPAHRCKAGAQLLGVRQNDGMIAILPQTLLIDEAFVQKTREHPITPERRFRFANKCIENGCKQWNGKGCNVAEEIIYYLNAIPIKDMIQSCSIRTHCRWYFQEGEDACKVCPYIQTEITEEELQNLK